MVEEKTNDKREQWDIKIGPVMKEVLVKQSLNEDSISSYILQKAELSLIAGRFARINLVCMEQT